MTKQKSTQNRILAIVSLSLVIAAATYGFAEADSISEGSIIGAGFGVKSSYAVSCVSYTLDVENPNSFVAVEFILDQNVTEINAGVSGTEKGDILWADDCTQVDSNWTCAFDESIDVLAADWLHVTSVQ